MKTKKKALLVVAFIMAVAVCCVALAACGGKQVAVTWKVDTNATVAVTGYKSLPEKVKDGEVISFTVTPKENYAVDTVKANGSTLKASNGTYTHTVSGETCEIEVTTKKVVDSLVVTTNPTKLSYHAGDMIDLSGMVITANYADGTNAVLTDKQYRTNTAVASLGDTKFTVTYEGKSVDVMYDQAVEVLITLNTDGGKINNEAYIALRQNADLNNVMQDEKGNITFTFASLGAAITLPTEVNKGINNAYEFSGWSIEGKAATAIAVDTEISTIVKANYKVNAVEYNNATLTVEGGKPILTLNATLTAVTKAQVFLYEGNKKVFVIDEAPYTGEIGKAFDIKCDLTALGESGHTGAWMDIRLVAIDESFEVPEGATEEEEMQYYVDHSQSLTLLDPENVFANVPSSISVGGKSYYFLIYKAGNNYDLKVVYKDDAAYTYALNMADESGKPVLTVTGTAAEEHEGKTITVTAHEAKGTGTVTGGKWTVKVPLDEIETMESFTNLRFQFGDDADFAPDIAYCTSSMKAFIGDLNFGGQYIVANELLSANGCQYYISINWNEPAIYAVDVAHQLKENYATLEIRNDKPYFVLEGIYGDAFTSLDEVKEAVIARFAYMDLEPMRWGSTQLSFEDVLDDEGNVVKPASMFVEVTDGMYRVFCDISAMPEDKRVFGDEIFAHYLKEGNNLQMNSFDDNTKIGWGDYEFKLGRTTASDPWKQSLVIIHVTANPAYAYQVTGISLEVAGDKAYAVLTGTCGEGYTSVDILKEKISLDCMVINGDWTTKKFTFVETPAEGENPAVPANATLTLDGDSFTAKFDMTAMGNQLIAGKHFMFHVSGGDLKLDPRPTVTPITVNGLTYNVGSSDAVDWAPPLTSILVTAAE